MTPVRRALSEVVKKTPVLGPLARRIAAARRPPPAPFTSSADYWERRYAGGGTSGAGSYGEFAEFKAEVVNAFVAEHGVRSVIEFGCGDGNQLALGRYPSYVGLDVSPSVVERCRKRFRTDATKSFLVTDDYDGRTAELALSLDVLYHLVEDDVFEQYLRHALRRRRTVRRHLRDRSGRAAGSARAARPLPALHALDRGQRRGLAPGSADREPDGRRPRVLRLRVFDARALGPQEVDHLRVDLVRLLEVHEVPGPLDEDVVAARAERVFQRALVDEIDAEAAVVACRGSRASGSASARR